MPEPQHGRWIRYNRVEQNLKDLLKKVPQPRLAGDAITGTSEETAGLFSSGTTPAVQMTMETHRREKT